MNNHRVISMQHKCIDPIGSSKSDYEICLAIMERLGMGAMYSEGGNTELDWCKRAFDSSDMSKHISWKQFYKKGYYVVPPVSPGARAPVANRWFYEDRIKDTPEPYPLPADYVEDFGKGLQTPSGKFEFVANTLNNIDDSGRPPLNKYMPTYESPERDKNLSEYTLQLLTPHSRYPFHIMGDEKGCTIRDIEDHRVRVDAEEYLVATINGSDADDRSIKNHDLIRLWNNRGSVVCAAYVTDRLQPGVVSVPTASAEYRPAGEPGNSTDLGGCINLLSPKQNITEHTHSIKPNTTLIQMEKWTGVDTWQRTEAL